MFLVRSDLQAQATIAPSKNLLTPSYALRPSPVPSALSQTCKTIRYVRDNRQNHIIV